MPINISSSYPGRSAQTDVSMGDLPVGGDQALRYLQALVARGPARRRHRFPQDNAASSRNIKIGERGSESLRRAERDRRRRDLNSDLKPSGSIPMIPADQFGPARIDWEKVASMGPEAMARIKAAAPDFLQ
jgi:hypothetical protein